MRRPMALWNRAAAHPCKTAFFLALALRLANLALLRGQDAFFAEPDTYAYWTLAAALAKPEIFWSTLLSLTERMPLYPLLLGGVQSLFGDAPRAVALMQAATDAGTCALIAALGVLLSPQIGLIAGILAALSVNLIAYSTQILTDTLFLLFFSGMLYSGALFLRNPTTRLAAIAGLAGGLSLATRPAVAILLLAAAPTVFAIAIVRRRSLAAAGVATAVFAIAAALPISPVVIRNAVHYGTWNLTTQTGQHLAFWIVPLVTQRADGTPYLQTVERMNALIEQRTAERGETAQKNPFILDAIKVAVAREALAQLPVEALAAAWIEGMVLSLASPALLADPRVRALPRPSFYNTPGRTLLERTRAYVFDDAGLYQVLLVAGLATTLPFLALSAIGFGMLVRTHPWAAVLGAGVIAYFLVLNGPVGAPKYRLPMEPVLIVLSAMPLAWMARRYGRPSQPARPSARDR